MCESCSSAASRRKLNGGAVPSAGAAGEAGKAQGNVCSIDLIWFAAEDAACANCRASGPSRSMPDGHLSGIRDPIRRNSSTTRRRS